MATFNKPKTFKPQGQAAASAKSSSFADDLGFDNDDISPGASSDEENASDQEEKDDGGVSILEFLALQRSLRRVTVEKTQIATELRHLKAESRKSDRILAQTKLQLRMQKSMMEEAQSKQLEERENLIDSARVSLKELEDGTGRTEGIHQMISQVKELSDEKRIYYEKATTLENELLLAKEEVTALENEFALQISELEKDSAEMRDQIDPVKIARSQAAGNVALDNEEIDRLRTETAELRAQLRDAQERQPVAAAPTSNVSSSEATQLQNQLQALEKKNKELKAELGTAKTAAAKLQAASASEADRDAATHELTAQLETELTNERTKTKSAVAEADELKTQLSDAQTKSKQLQAELDSLKNSLSEQQAQLASASGSAKDVQAELASRGQELASTKAKLSSEQEAHQEAKDKLQAAKQELAALKDDYEKSQSDASHSLRQEKERHAEVVQKLQAAKAEELAEAEQRASEEMKDLKERLSSLSGQLGPAMEAIKFISGAYKALRKETRTLQGEVEPMFKQCKRDMLRTLADVDKQYKEMMRKYRKEMALRKKLHNELVDLKGNIRVFGRIRPMISEDGKGPDSKLVVETEPADDQLIKAQRKGKTETYEMDFVFSAESTQEDVFKQARDVIVSCIDGYNVCIFAYGQTGSGKTFTMDGPDDNPGLNRRALGELFNIVAEKSQDWSYEIEVSVLEIYNETINDLLADKPVSGGLDIRHSKTGIHVEGLIKTPVTNAQEVRQLFLQAQKIRASASTDMNERSSRSHALLVVYVTGTNLTTGVQTSGKLNLIDLAGSERVEKSGAINDPKRLKEATSINKSLSCLGDVIHALGAKQKHVPYRNSKLTHLLQDSLGGSAKTIMVVQVSPVLKNVDESANSLRFALRVRSVELGNAKKSSESAEVASLRKKVKELEGKR